MLRASADAMYRRRLRAHAVTLMPLDGRARVTAIIINTLRLLDAEEGF